MRKFLWIMFLICVAMTSLTCRKGEEVYEIGAILPLTGPAASEGEFQKLGIELATDEINQVGGIKGKKITVFYHDSKYNAKEGISAFQALIWKKIPVVISTMSSVSAPLASYITEQNEYKGPVVFVTSSSDTGVTGKNDWVFRTFLLSENESKTMASFMVSKLGRKHIAVSYINDEYGLGAYKTLQNEVNVLGGKIVWKESFNKGETNHRNILEKLKTSQHDALYIVGQDKSYALAIKQCKEIGLSTQLFTTIALSVPEWRELIGDSALEGIYYTEAYYSEDSHDKVVMKFVADYEKKFGKKPNVVAAFTYTIMKMIYETIKDGEKDSSILKERIKDLKNIKSPVGDITISGYEADIPARIMVFKEGKPENVF